MEKKFVYGGKLTLVKSTLSNIFIYYLLTLTIAVKIVKRFRKYSMSVPLGGMI